MNANNDRVEHEIDIRVPIYGHRMLKNLTLDSFIFRNTIRYTVIMAISIFIALMFDFEKAYWIPLSTHTVLLGSTTLHSFEELGQGRWHDLRGVGVITHLINNTACTSSHCFIGFSCRCDRNVCRCKLLICSYIYHDTSYLVKWISVKSSNHTHCITKNY